MEKIICIECMNIKMNCFDHVTGVIAISISCYYYLGCFLLHTQLKTRNNFLQKWMDDRLRWSEAKYPDVAHVYCPSSEIWTPQLFIVNSWVLWNVCKETFWWSLHYGFLSVPLEIFKEMIVDHCSCHKLSVNKYSTFPTLI